MTVSAPETTTPAFGQDRSDWNPVTSWGTLAFGIAKASEGLGLADATFAGNWKNLKDENKVRGAYHFFHPGADPVKQAQFFHATVKAQGLYDGDILVIDTELLQDPAGAKIAPGSFVSHHQAQPSTEEDLALTPAEVDSRSKAFLDELVRLEGDEAKHRIVMVYTMNSVGQHLTETAKAYPNLWFAHPGGRPTAALIAPWTDWKVWQYATVPAGDLDEYNGTGAELRAWRKSVLPVLPPVIVHWRVLKPTTLAGAARRHNTTPLLMIQAAAKAGHRYGEWMKRYITRGDWNALLPIGTTLYAYEEAK